MGSWCIKIEQYYCSSCWMCWQPFPEHANGTENRCRLSVLKRWVLDFLFSRIGPQQETPGGGGGWGWGGDTDTHPADSLNKFLSQSEIPVQRECGREDWIQSVLWARSWSWVVTGRALAPIPVFMGGCVGGVGGTPNWFRLAGRSVCVTPLWNVVTAVRLPGLGAA